jgi:hypothetical protein
VYLFGLVATKTSPGGVHLAGALALPLLALQGEEGGLQEGISLKSPNRMCDRYRGFRHAAQPKWAVCDKTPDTYRGITVIYSSLPASIGNAG